MPILGHDPRLEFYRQRGLRRILGIGFFGFERMDGGLGSFAPGVAHFIATLVVRAFLDTAQQQRQSDTRRNQRQQDHPGRDENQQIPLRKGLGPHQQRHRHHTRQRHRTAHAANRQQPARARRRHLGHCTLAAPAS
ncbi:hypothetical protein D3C87_1662140 [compost metagenome]